MHVAMQTHLDSCALGASHYSACKVHRALADKAIAVLDASSPQTLAFATMLD